MAVLRTALCQINTVVGDIAGNVARILDALGQAEDAGCALAVFPELAICGYPPEDLLMKRRFVADARAGLDEVAGASGECFAVVGFPAVREDGGGVGGEDGGGDGARDQPWLYNAAAVCGRGRIQAVVHKTHLPNYAVFDEHRYFAEGRPHPAVEIGGIRVGVSICEDLWVDGGAIEQIAGGGAGGGPNAGTVADADASTGAASQLVVNINASPYHIGKWDRRQELLARRSRQYGQPFVYVNQVGGQDELVFDGMSAVFGGAGPDSAGQLTARCAQFVEQIMVVDIEVPGAGVGAGVDAVAAPPAQIAPQLEPQIAPQLEPLAEIYEALKLGLSDYIKKNRFRDVCVGLSGGIDSSLVATIAADALGPGQVHGVLMPSRYSSEHSLADAKQLCLNLGIDHSVVPIEPAHSSLMDMLQPYLGGAGRGAGGGAGGGGAEGDTDSGSDSGDSTEHAGLTEENLQSRIRGIVLMAFANARGWLNLTTGNKSESAVGYSTLYGDTAGAFAVIKDVWKQQVYALAQHRNQQAAKQGHTPPIPESTLTKAPSAELRPDQRDDQSLPPYDQLDPLLEAIVERDLTGADLLEAGAVAVAQAGTHAEAGAGADPELVARISRLVDLAEYKRRQNPPGIRITEKAFGKDRRMPITHGYLGMGDGPAG